MRFIIYSVLLLAFLTQSIYAQTASESLKSLLSPVQSLQARFEQVMRNDHGTVLQRSTGKMQLKKPGKFRWEIMDPEPRLVIANGKKVWDYDKELNQVTIQKIGTAQNKTPIYFLTGEVASLDKDFIITEAVGAEKNTANFELKPKKEEGAFQWIRVSFKDQKIHQLELLDQLGQRSIFTLSSVVLNPNLPDNIFEFTPPKGVDVLESR